VGRSGRFYSRYQSWGTDGASATWRLTQPSRTPTPALELWRKSGWRSIYPSIYIFIVYNMFTWYGAELKWIFFKSLPRDLYIILIKLHPHSRTLERDIKAIVIFLLFFSVIIFYTTLFGYRNNTQFNVVVVNDFSLNEEDFVFFPIVSHDFVIISRFAGL